MTDPALLSSAEEGRRCPLTRWLLRPCPVCSESLQARLVAVTAHQLGPLLPPPGRFFSARRGVYCEQPDEASYKAAIIACSGANQWERALGLFRGFQRATPAVPGTATYNAVITACARGLYTEEALAFFREMAERGVPRDEVRDTLHVGDRGKMDLLYAFRRGVRVV